MSEEPRDYAPRHDAGEQGRTMPEPTIPAEGAHHHHSHSGHHSHRHRRSHRGLIIVLVIIAVVLALAGVAGAYAYSLYSSVQQVKADATAAKSVASDLDANSISSLEFDGLSSQAVSLAATAHDIQSELSGTKWDIAERLPIVGQDVASVRTLVNTVVDLADNALMPMADVLEQTDLSNLMRDGAIDVASIEKLANVVSDVAPVLDGAKQTLDSLPTSRIEQVNDLTVRADEAVDEVSGIVDSLNAVLPSLPAALGADGPRTYLLVAQNNAEIRATGGFPGAFAPVTVTDGVIELGDVSTLAGARDHEFEITDEERSIFGDGMAISVNNLNMTPDFPRAASLLSQAWLTYMGQAVDGVIAVDPVFLQRLLGLVGGVTLDDGTVVDGTNAARVLLSDTYWYYGNDGEAQDAFFAYVAQTAAGHIMASLGQVDLKSLLGVLQDSAGDGRLMVWFADEAEEATAITLGVDGALSTDPTAPELGVYVNDDTWAKMTWYLDINTAVGQKTQNPDGTSTYTVTTSYTNVITPDEAYSAPSYVTGNSPMKRSVDDMYIKPLLVAPAGGTITNVIMDNGGEMAEGSLYGFDEWSGAVNLASGETVTITFDVTVPAGTTADLAVRETPTGQEFPAPASAEQSIPAEGELAVEEELPAA